MTEAIMEAAVVPASGPMRTAVPKAHASLCAGTPPDRATSLPIFQHSRSRRAPFKRVRLLEFADPPKTIAGEIHRVELRQEGNQRASTGTRVAGEFREEDFPESRQT